MSYFDISYGNIYIKVLGVLSTMEEVKVSNLVKFFSLFFLYQGPKHGYELIKEIESQLGKKPSTGQIYPFMNTLLENKLIRTKEEGDREKKVYELTKEGKRFVEKKLEMFGGVISANIEKDLSTCAHCGCKLFSGGYEEVIGGKKLSFCCMHCAGTFKR
jgi:DNA-binding PadR family transcriptional regulator